MVGSRVVVFLALLCERIVNRYGVGCSPQDAILRDMPEKDDGTITPVAPIAQAPHDTREQTSSLVMKSISAILVLFG